MDKILQITDKREFVFLRKKTARFDFAAHTPKNITDMLQRMKRAMREARGVGLSANQIGIDAQMFVAEVPGANRELKFYAVFNPNIEKMSEEKVTSEEGCLSIVGKYGDVPRATNLVLRGFDKRGKPIKIKAWGLLARVFQHETDHLNGKLFIDRATKMYEAATSEQLQKHQSKVEGRGSEYGHK
jgi:peptide deformylase